MSLILEAVSGEGRMGLLGLFSLLKDRISETLSFGFEAELAIWWWARARNGDGEPGDLARLMMKLPPSEAQPGSM